ncbi:hypothetical protein GIB67_037874 [Kingdonia uniflora]|uniref:Uncharacterized protein n=1 Tax=Kingdonia uniflora TaxID=39325 RepID=A0A7J7LGX0_9MAGN|nr:hypothetical protein GIB67_037874 [Kingdonia uniflora]
MEIGYSLVVGFFWFIVKGLVEIGRDHQIAANPNLYCDSQIDQVLSSKLGKIKVNIGAYLRTVIALVCCLLLVSSLPKPSLPPISTSQDRNKSMSSPQIITI